MNGTALGENISRVGLERAVIRWQRQRQRWQQLVKSNDRPVLCQVVRNKVLTTRPVSCSNSASAPKTPTNKPRKRGQKRRKRRGGHEQEQQQQSRQQQKKPPTRPPAVDSSVQPAEERPEQKYHSRRGIRRKDYASNKAKSPTQSDALPSPSLATKEDLETTSALDYESWDELRDSYIDLDLTDINERAARSGQAFEDAYLDDYAVYLNSLPKKSSVPFVWRYLFNHVPEVVVCALSTFCGYAVGRYADIQVDWSVKDKEMVCTAIGMLAGLTLGKYGVSLAREAISRILSQPRETLIARTIGSLMGIIACLLAVYPFISNRNKAYETDPDLRDALYALLGFLIYNTIRVAVDVADKSLPEFIRTTIGVMKEERQAGREPYWLSSVVSTLEENEEDDNYTESSVIDTSALIDGQLAGIASVGFLDGDLIIPGEVLSELQAMAGAVGQPSRQLRGRRGLDAIQNLKTVARDRIKISPSIKSYESSAAPRKMADAWKDVDGEILRLALEQRSTLVTCDFGLQERALKAGLKMVFNPRELAASMSNSVLPGQRLAVKLVGPGLKKGQARAISADHYALQIIVVDSDIDMVPFRGGLAGVIVLATTQSGGGTTAFVRLDADPWPRPSTSSSSASKQ